MHLISRFLLLLLLCTQQVFAFHYDERDKKCINLSNVSLKVHCYDFDKSEKHLENDFYIEINEYRKIFRYHWMRAVDSDLCIEIKKSVAQVVSKQEHICISGMKNSLDDLSPVSWTFFSIESGSNCWSLFEDGCK